MLTTEERQRITAAYQLRDPRMRRLKFPQMWLWATRDWGAIWSQLTTRPNNHGLSNEVSLFAAFGVFDSPYVSRGMEFSIAGHFFFLKRVFFL